jgi:hypothetical protein
LVTGAADAGEVDLEAMVAALAEAPAAVIRSAVEEDPALVEAPAAAVDSGEVAADLVVVAPAAGLAIAPR